MEYGFGCIIRRSPYTPYSIYLRGNILLFASTAKSTLLRNLLLLGMVAGEALAVSGLRLMFQGYHGMARKYGNVEAAVFPRRNRCPLV